MARAMTQVPASLSAPVWTNDFLSREHLVPGGAKLNAAEFFAADSVLATVGAGGAAIGAVSIPVTALTGAIPAGTSLDFGGAKLAITTAAVAAGAVAIPVRALPTALAAGDVARYAGVGMRTVPSGTPVGRTLAERDASTPFGPLAAGDDEVYVTAFDVTDVVARNDAELVRPNTTILKENFLPGWAGLAAAVQTLVRGAYICVRGAE